MSTSTKPATRIEKDSLGYKEIPADVYYGIQTARAVENFPISGLRAHSNAHPRHRNGQRSCCARQSRTRPGR